MAAFPPSPPDGTFRQVFSPVVRFVLSPSVWAAAGALSLWAPAVSAQAPPAKAPPAKAPPAKAPPAQAPQATTPPPTAPERSLLRQLYGDLAVEARTRGAGSLVLAVSDGRTSVVLNLMATDLRRWSDSASRILAAPAPRRGQSAKWEAAVAGPGVAAGSVSLARRVAPGDTGIVLLVTDAEFRGVRTELAPEEARALSLALRRAALASMPPPTPRKPPR